MEDTVLRAEDLQRFCEECLIDCEVEREEASIVADSLVKADLRGVESHGVTRLGIYVKRLKRGVVNPRPTISVVSERDAALLIDGDNGLGQIVAMKALNLGIAKAKQSGSVSIGVKHSNHYGGGAYYVQHAVSRDMIAFAYSNAPPTMAPWGGVEPYIGTNPYSYGVPAGQYEPIIFDMATSVVAQGKIILAAKKGEPIPAGWAIDKDGKPATDADAALEGTVLPFGGPKGYAISLMVDIMAGVLTGAGFGPRINNLWTNFDEPQDVGVFVQLIDIDSFMPVETFKERIDQMISEIKSLRKAEGTEEIFMPGEIEHRMEQQRLDSGIALNPNALQELREVGESCDVSLDDFVRQS